MNHFWFFNEELIITLLLHTDARWPVSFSEKEQIQIRDTEGEYVNGGNLEFAWIAEVIPNGFRHEWIVIAKIRTNLWSKGIILTQSDRAFVKTDKYKRMVDLNNWKDPFESYLSGANFFPEEKTWYGGLYHGRVTTISKYLCGHFHFEYRDEPPETYKNLWLSLEQSIRHIARIQGVELDLEAEPLEWL